MSEQLVSVRRLSAFIVPPTRAEGPEGPDFPTPTRPARECAWALVGEVGPGHAEGRSRECGRRPQSRLFGSEAAGGDPAPLARRSGDDVGHARGPDPPAFAIGADEVKGNGAGITRGVDPGHLEG